MCKFIFYAINNVLNENIIIFYFFYYYFESKKLECQEKIIRIKKPKKKVNVHKNKENVYEKIILQDVEHDDNIDLDGVD